ncbi:hypothetical protein [Phytohabitans rumicis]|uniref:Uncharacterized protein n=1 Tax=Phytohabitans rumicis TaxID=1076125 RepID=A0A6V8L9Q7_9ACTN|nr:hypothetical protein [Phytohabitans rumicis]GFJ90767.1 hypothetical protein Prum_044090 [Phytohabitans rumicis]
MADLYPRTPSGLFPSRPPRPTYREPHRVRAGGLTAGLGAGVAWLLFIGLLGRDLRGYVWWTVLAGALAWAAAWTLSRQGDRGVAAGVAISTGVGWSVAAAAIAVRWGMTGDWPLW